MINEHKFNYDSFIGGWYISDILCDEIVSYFKDNINISHEGIAGGIINKNLKDSKDIDISPNLIHPLFNEYRINLQKCLDEYIKKYKFINFYAKFNVNTSYHIQHYSVNGGFKKWHFENSSKTEANRILVFMTYLNDVEDGGTEFYYQKIKSPCKKGLTLIWPTGFTHTHKGQISKTKEKYISTGWFTFN
jgi:hypothetical protein